jgi:hypothetical protein
MSFCLDDAKYNDYMSRSDHDTSSINTVANCRKELVTVERNKESSLTHFCSLSGFGKFAFRNVNLIAV